MHNIKPESNRLRKGRFSEPNRPYLATAVCTNRQPVFNSLWTGRCFALSIGDLQSHAHTWCYVVMPDHIHWLMQPLESLNLSQCVQRIKSFTTRRLHQGGFIEKVVWQRGFHDHAVRKDEELKTLARYVISNPIRAGLVKRIADYPHWDAAWI